MRVYENLTMFQLPNTDSNLPATCLEAGCDGLDRISPASVFSHGSPYETQSSAVIINIPLASLIDPFIESHVSTGRRTVTSVSSGRH